MHCGTQHVAQQVGRLLPLCRGSSICFSLQDEGIVNWLGLHGACIAARMPSGHQDAMSALAQAVTPHKHCGKIVWQPKTRRTPVLLHCIAPTLPPSEGTTHMLRPHSWHLHLCASVLLLQLCQGLLVCCEQRPPCPCEATRKVQSRSTFPALLQAQDKAAG